MAKGALAIGVGAALLLGGGGTLATWNASANSSAGTIASGELGLKAEAGKWQAGAAPLDSAAVLPTGFKAVPGDVFSFTQPLTVTLSGTNMVADLTANNTVASVFGNEATVAVTYSKDNGASWTAANEALKTSGTIKARITVTFTDKGVGGNAVTSSKQTADMNAIGFTLQQRAVTAP